MYTHRSNNVSGQIFLQEISILFFNNNSIRPIDYEVIDVDDINILSPNYKIEEPESPPFEIKKHGTYLGIVDHYVEEIQRVTKGKIVEEWKTFLANIIYDYQKAKVKFVEIDEKIYKLWKKDRGILSCFNKKSIDMIKGVTDHLCFTRQILYESEANLKYLLEKYVEKNARETLLTRVCFVIEKDEKLSKRMDQTLLSEILRLELEELIDKLKKMGGRLNSLLIENQKLIEKNVCLKEKNIDDKLVLDFDELVKQKEIKKMKQILKVSKKKLLNLEQNLKDNETENSKLLTNVTLASKQLDYEIIKNQRTYNGFSLELVHVGKLNRLGEAELSKAIDIGAELLEDISKVNNHLTKKGFKIQTFTVQNNSKDSYFADCIETGRDFINKLFIQLKILMDKIPNLETNLRSADWELKAITKDVIEFKKEKSELKKEILSEKMELEKTIQILANPSTDDELSDKSKNYPTRNNKLMKFYKYNYELSDKLLQAETCCNDLVCKLEDADNEKENLKMTIKKQEEMLKENQTIIDGLKSENVTLKSKNDDLLGSLIASMVLLYCSKKIVSNWIQDNEAKQSKS